MFRLGGSRRIQLHVLISTEVYNANNFLGSLGLSMRINTRISFRSVRFDEGHNS